MSVTTKKRLGEIKQAAVVLAELGADDDTLGRAFGKHPRWIGKLRETHPDLDAAIAKAKTDADAKVVQSLYRRATGYEHPEPHISTHEGKVTVTEFFDSVDDEGKPVRKRLMKHIVPDTTACIFWLKNRQPQDWQDRMDLSARFNVQQKADPKLIAAAQECAAAMLANAETHSQTETRSNGRELLAPRHVRD